MRTKLPLLTAVLVLLCVSSRSASADTIRVNFDVAVGITEGAIQDIFGVPVHTGDVLRGSFTINSLAVDTNPRPDFGRYRGTGQSLQIDLGTGLSLPIQNWTVFDFTSCCADMLQTGAISRVFPGFDLVGALVFLFAPPESRQGDRLPQSAAELAAYTSGQFVLEARLASRPSVTHEIRGTLRVRDVSSQPIPEPGTLLLIGTGAAGLIASRRRRARTGAN
jgi:hypothetical protein